MPFQKKTNILFLVLFCTFFSSAQQATESNSSAVSESNSTNYLAPNQLLITDSIVNYGKLFLNTPYRYGSSGTDSFDCSGFTSYVYRNFGYNLQRSSADQAQQFDTVNRNDLKSGDLVYFSGRRRSKNVGHVGIVVKAKENGEFDFIHAAVHSGVTISSSDESYYTKRFVKANRVVGANSLLNILPELSKVEDKSTDLQIQTPFSEPVKQTEKIISAEYHVVKSGETLSSIAEKYDLTVAELKQKNNIEGNKINRKQRLIVKDEETVMVSEAIESKAERATELPIVAKTNKTEQAASIATASHIVKKGETLFSISKLYCISVEDLKKINKLQGSSIQLNQEIKLNDSAVQIAQKSSPKMENAPKVAMHKVKKGESLFSISRMYNMTSEELKNINKLESNKLQLDQELKLSGSAEQTAQIIVAQSDENPKVVKTSSHKVQSGESLFSISKMYSISTEELKKINKLENNSIRAGQELIVIQSTASNERVAEKTTSASEKKLNTATHVVKSGDSFFSIAKVYGCTVDKIKEWNNKSDNRLSIGDKLVIITNQLK